MFFVLVVRDVILDRCWRGAFDLVDDGYLFGTPKFSRNMLETREGPSFLKSNSSHSVPHEA